MMARTFNGTSDYGSVTLNLSSYSKVSIALWFYWDAFANNDDELLEYTANYNNANGFVLIPNDITSGRFGIVVHQTALGYNGGDFARPSAAQWLHGVFTFDRNGSTALQVAAFINGTTQSIAQNYSNAVTGNFDNSTLYVMSRGGASVFGAGRVADLAVWGGVLLTGSDANQLYSGLSFPNDLYRDNLIGYWPFCGVENPEPDQSVTNADIVINGTTRSKHPRNNPFCFVSASNVPLSAFE